MDAEVMTLIEERRKRGRDIADAELERAAVVNDFVCDEGADDLGGKLGFLAARGDWSDGRGRVYSITRANFVI
jgi:hypothetical protein